MAFGPRHDVHKGERDIVLINFVRRDFAAQNLAEDVVRIIGGGHGVFPSSDCS